MADSKLSALTAITWADIESTDLWYIADLSASASKKLAHSELLSILAAKAPLASPTFTGTVSGITAAMVDLGNVVNVDTTTTANITDSTDKRFVTDAQLTKLGYITVTQAVDLDQIESDTATNNAKVTNATHTGDATGATALTVVKIQGKDFPTLSASDNNKYPRYNHGTGAFVMDNPATGSVAWGDITGSLSNQTDLQSALDAKQDTLVSATNIKTINSNSILGPGDLVISASAAWGGITGTLSSQTDLNSALNAKIPYTGASSAVDLGTNNLTVDTNTLFVDATNNQVSIGLASGVTAAFEIQSLAAAKIVQKLRAHASQSVDIEQWTASDGTTVRGGIQNYGVPFAYGAYLDSTNTAFGINTMDTASGTPVSNTGFGNNVMTGTLSGSFNSCFGDRAAVKITSASYNTVIGMQALSELLTTNDNIGVGYRAGRNIVAGTANGTPSTSIYIGNNTRAFAASQANEIVIGDSADGNGTNTVTLGNTSITKTFLRGSIMIPTLTNAAAANSSLYYSSDASKLVWKDAGGTVNNLY